MTKKMKNIKISIKYIQRGLRQKDTNLISERPRHETKVLKYWLDEILFPFHWESHGFQKTPRLKFLQNNSYNVYSVVFLTLGVL